MLRVNWQDQEIKVRGYTSLTGDMIKLGTTTSYPFEPGGSQGVPLGWSPYYENGAVYTDVSRTVGQGRFSIGNLVADVNGQSGKRYGIYKDFAVTPGKYYIIGVQCRTTQGRSHTIRYVRFGNGANHNYIKMNQMWSFDDWEDIAINAAAYASSGILRVNLMACPYVSDPKGMVTDANWGIQFQNVTINEQEATYPQPTWHEITCDIKGVGIHYGRDKFTSRYNTATATVKVDNKDSYYTYGTNHADDLRPGRFIKLTMTLPGSSTERSMYYGVIDSFSDSYDIDGSATVDLSCVDPTSLLATMTVPTMMSRDDLMQSGFRFNTLLDGVGFLFSMKNNAWVSFTQQAIVNSGRTVRDECGVIADSEGGYFFAERNGTVTFYGRRWNANYARNNTVQAELLATPYCDNLPVVDTIPTANPVFIVELKQLGSDWSRDRVVNDISISNQDGTAFRYQDFESQKKYGPFTYQRLDFVNDNAAEPTYADQRAADIMTGYTTPILRVNSVEFVPQPENFEWCAKAFLEELVRVRYEHPVKGWGWVSATHIQGYTHSLTPTSWRMSIALDHPESYVFYEQSDGSGWDVSLWDVDIWDEFNQEGGYWDSGQVWGDVNYLDSSKGYASTPDTPKDSLVANGTYRLTIDAQIDSLPAGQFPWLIQKIEGGTNFREYSAYQYQNGSVINWSGYNTANVDITIVNPIPYGARHSFGMEWTYGVTGGVAIVDGVRTARTSSVAPIAKDTNASILIGSSVATTGKLYGAKLERIVAGAVSELIWEFNAAEWTGGTTFTDPRGRVWTFSNASAIVGAPVDIVAMWNE